MGMNKTYSLMMVGRNTGIELKATLQLKNMIWEKISSGLGKWH